MHNLKKGRKYKYKDKGIMNFQMDIFTSNKDQLAQEMD